MSTALVIQNKKIQQKRLEEERLKKMQDSISPGKIAADTTSIVSTASSLYNNIQENIVKQSGLIEKTMNYQLPDGSFDKINIFIRNPIEKKGFVRDTINTLTAPSKDRIKVNPEFIEKLNAENIYDRHGKVIEGITSENFEDFDNVF